MDRHAAQSQPLYGVANLDIRPCSRSRDLVSAPDVGIIADRVRASSCVPYVGCFVLLSEDVRILEPRECEQRGNVCCVRIRPQYLRLRSDPPGARLGSCVKDHSCCDGFQKRDFALIERSNLARFYPFAPSRLRQHGPEGGPTERRNILRSLRNYWRRLEQDCLCERAGRSG